MASDTQGYKSRKFVVTMYAMTIGSLITGGAMFASPAEGFFTALSGLYILLAAGIAAYNWSNLREGQSEAGK